jgi:hypothetical protein
VGSKGSVTGNGKMSTRSKRTFGRAALAATIGMAVVIGSAGTFARAADDDDDALLDTKILRGIMKGLGMRKEEASIDYRERSPLVLPPGKELQSLPTPESDARAKKTAGWPDDPDIKAVKQRKDAERDRKPYTEGVDDRPLLPSQYENPTRVKRDNASGGSVEDASRPSTQAELGAKSLFSKIWGPKDEFATFVAEPPRGSLIDPPPGYRTPSPNQPFGVGKTKGDYKSVDRQEPVR